MSYASIPAWPLTRDDGNAVVARSLHLCVLRLFTADDEELHVGSIETHATRLTVGTALGLRRQSGTSSIQLRMSSAVSISARSG
jgi:hypothetical protein